MVNTSALVRVAKPSYNAQSSTGMERLEYGGIGPYLGATNARLAWSVVTTERFVAHHGHGSDSDATMWPYQCSASGASYSGRWRR